MAEVDIAPNFGAELRDGFKPVNAWVADGISWLGDIEMFYRERSAIEREYSQKLNTLAKKYFEKKAKKSSSLSVGDSPTVTPGSLESASMTTWTVQLTTLESRAAEHERLSAELIRNLAEPLKLLAAKYEDLRKSHAEYAAKLEKERDGSYTDLKKTKGKYDSVCQEVENRRKKMENSFEHGKGKAQGAYQQQQADMRNVKNTYLISINVINKQKERYYHEYVPDLLDSLQGLSEARTAKLNGLWSVASSLETQTMKRSSQLLDHLSGEIPRNNPVLDSMMFVRHNASTWQDPADFGFEPSPVWLDDDAMAADPQAKTFLMNVLAKSKGSLGELRRECEGRRKEVEGAKRVRQLIREGKDKRDEVEVVRAQFHQQELLHEAERQMISAEVEVSTITSAVGDIRIGARNHAFKNQTFKLPTNCDLCGDRIWGLSAKGMACEECGFTCHTKCQMKAPADCPGELDKDAKKKVKAERQATAQSAAASPAAPAPPSNGDDAARLSRSDTMGSMNTLSSGYAASAHRSVSGAKPADEPGPAVPAKPGARRVVAPPPTSHAKPNGAAATDDAPRGRMLYPYQATGAGEISVADGADVAILEPDDGGWVRIRPLASDGGGAAAGLVPTSYVEASHYATAPGGGRPVSTASASTASLSSTSTLSATHKKQGPAVTPRRGRKVRYVQALYAYAGQGEGEASMEEGERMVLVVPDGGDGWCEVEGREGRGVVPAGWVKEV